MGFLNVQSHFVRRNLPAARPPNQTRDCGPGDWPNQRDASKGTGSSVIEKAKGALYIDFTVTTQPDGKTLYSSLQAARLAGKTVPLAFRDVAREGSFQPVIGWT